MTIHQSAYVARRRDIYEPQLRVHCHPSAQGTVIVEVRTRPPARERTVELRRLAPNGKVVESAS